MGLYGVGYAVGHTLLLHQLPDPIRCHCTGEPYPTRGTATGGGVNSHCGFAASNREYADTRMVAGVRPSHHLVILPYLHHVAGHQ
jgi:hypothetical protein